MQTTTHTHHTPNALGRATAILTALLTILLALTGCGTATGTKPQPQPEPTSTVVFPADFVDPYTYSKGRATPRYAAEDYKSLGQKYCTDAHARKDGAVVATLTKTQRRNSIRLYQDGIDDAAKSLHRNSPDYHYTVNRQLTELDAWVDSRLNPFGGSAVTYLIPIYSGYIHYLQGGTGHWDMTIRLYNCHDNQLKKQFTLRDESTFTDTISLGN